MEKIESEIAVGDFSLTASIREICVICGSMSCMSTYRTTLLASWTYPRIVGAHKLIMRRFNDVSASHVHERV